VGDEVDKSVVVTHRAIGLDIGVAKEVIGKPTLLANGNFQIDYEVVVENNGVVDLVDVSVVDDIATQFGPSVLKNVSGLTLVKPPTNANSSIRLDLLGWDGTAATDVIDRSVKENALAAGDSFVIGFKAEIDASAISSVLKNRMTVQATAVDRSGVALLDVTGARMMASDTSDSGKDPTKLNSGDPTSLLVPRIGLVKSRGDAVASAENWEVKFTLVWENTGTVALDKVEIFDDLAARFGGQFAGVTLDSVTAAAGNAGSAPTANDSFALDTSTSLVTSTGPLEVGDGFEVAFTVSIDPNAVGTAARGLDSQSIASAVAVDANGDPVILPNGSPAFTHRVSIGEVEPERGTEKNDLNGTIEDDPATKVVADVAVARSVARTPTLLPNGNFEVVYELVTTNTGSVDLAELTLVQDLTGQIGATLVSGGKVVLSLPPSDARSSLSLDSAFNGTEVTDIVDQTRSSLLAAGDSFTVQFSVEVDSEAVGLPCTLENRTVSGSETVDVESASISENDIVDALACESSSAGFVEIVQEHVECLTATEDQGRAEVPAQLYQADLAISKSIVGEPILTELGNYVVAYQMVIDNSGTVDLASLSLLEDVFTLFGRAFVKAGNLSITSAPSDPGSSVSLDSAGWNGKISTELLDGSVSNVLVAGDSFTLQFEVEVNPSRGMPPMKNHAAGEIAEGVSDQAMDSNGVALEPLTNLALIGNVINSFIDAPGPIYSGMPINQVSNPLPQGNQPSFAGRYPIGDGSIMSGG
jgi:hypothetical protein